MVDSNGIRTERRTFTMFEPWQRVLLEQSRVARIATIAANGEPQTVPVCFAVVDNLLAIAIDEKPKGPARNLARLRNIQRDPRVTLLVDHYDDSNWENLAWVRVHGTAEVLDDGSEWPVAVAALRAKYSQYEAMALESLPMIRIQPRRVVSWRWQTEN